PAGATAAAGARMRALGGGAGGDHAEHAGRLRGVPGRRRHLGAPAAVPAVRSRRLLRLLAGPARIQALRRRGPPGDAQLRARRVVALVLRGQQARLMADCLFCQIAAGEVESYAVYESDTIYGFLDVRPVFKGHTLLVPRHHLDTLLDLPDELMPDLLGAARAVAGAVRDGLGAQGSFVAINNVVSQSVPHL